MMIKDEGFHQKGNSTLQGDRLWPGIKETRVTRNQTSMGFSTGPQKARLKS